MVDAAEDAARIPEAELAPSVEVLRRLGGEDDPSPLNLRSIIGACPFGRRSRTGE